LKQLVGQIEHVIWKEGHKCQERREHSRAIAHKIGILFNAQQIQILKNF
jgi:hypothetical protein